jgi:hypothetical protein
MAAARVNDRARSDLIVLFNVAGKLPVFIIFMAPRNDDYRRINGLFELRVGFFASKWGQSKWGQFSHCNIACFAICATVVKWIFKYSAISR